MSAAERGEFDNVFEFPALAALGAGTVGPGASGWEVEELQQRLVKLGFVGVQTTGTYDALTKAAVAAVQRGMQKPDNGTFDRFLDATLTRAMDVPGSLEANVVAAAAASFAASPEAVASATGLPATVAQPGSPQIAPMVVQVPGDQATHQPAQPIWKKPLFWLALVGGGLALHSLFKGAPTLPSTATSGAQDGVDDPDEFFAEAPKKRKRKKPKKAAAPRKRKALPATVSEEVDGDEPEDVSGVDDAPEPAAEAAPDVVDGVVVEKPKRKRKKKASGDLPERDEKGHFLPRE